MSRTVTRRWTPAAPPGVRTRPVIYSAVVPDALTGRELVFPAAAATAISRAESAIARLQKRWVESTGPRFAELLLRIEAVSSVRVTGSPLRYDRMASVLVGEGTPERSITLALAVQDVLRQAIRLSSEEDWAEPSRLADVAETLGRGMGEREAVSYRRHQIWLGGTPTPRHAEYIPPPPDMLLDLVNDLCAFLSRGDVPPVAAAAIGLAQFEAIQPFLRGNALLARCLPALVLSHWGLVDHLLPPVSAVLASDPRGYAAGLSAFRDGDIAGWCRLYARAVEIACIQAIHLCDGLTRLQRTWLHAVGKVRADSAAVKLIPHLLDHPTVTTTSAQRLVDVSDEAGRVAVMKLERAGILREITGMEYRRAWSAKDVFMELENFHFQVDEAGWPDADAAKPPSRRTS